MAAGNEHLKDRLIVAAIDFGTTYSGYAFSFKHEHTKDPLKIYLNKRWEGGGQSLMSEKAPTSVLLRPDKTLEAFGYQAEDKFADLCDDRENDAWYFLKHFKMVLHKNKTLDRHTTIEASNGQHVSALLVFSSAIGYLKDHMIKMAKSRQAQIKESDIYWVLTVPAIWDDSAKQFMREAAQKAGIGADQLMLALEPEAASVYCKHLPVHRQVSDQTLLTVFEPKSKYLVIDAGGGTIDISAQQVQPDGRLKQLYRATGGPWGGSKVNENFRELLETIFGQMVVIEFQSSCPGEYLELMRDFEHRKRDIAKDGKAAISIRIPSGLRECYQTANQAGSLDNALRSFSGSSKCRLVGDKFRFDSSLILPLFESVIHETVQHVEEVLANPMVEGVDKVLLVGGFAACNMLQDSLKEAFPNINFTIPEEAQLVVLQGAVLFGYQLGIISSRRSAYTYGIEIGNSFDPTKHPLRLKTIIEGREYCNKVFDTFITIDEEAHTDSEIANKVYCPSKTNATEVTLAVYHSEKDAVQYTDDEGCKKLGQMTVEMPDTTGGLSREVSVKIFSGGTEMRIEAQDKTTGENFEATFDFLTK